MHDMVMRYAQDRATSGSCTARYPHVLLGRGSVSNVSWAMTVRPLEGSRFASHVEYQRVHGLLPICVLKQLSKIRT